MWKKLPKQQQQQNPDKLPSHLWSCLPPNLKHVNYFMIGHVLYIYIYIYFLSWYVGCFLEERDGAVDVLCYRSSALFLTLTDPISARGMWRSAVQKKRTPKCKINRVFITQPELGRWFLTLKKLRLTVSHRERAAVAAACYLNGVTLHPVDQTWPYLGQRRKQSAYRPPLAHNHLQYAHIHSQVNWCYYSFEVEAQLTQMNTSEDQ